MGRKLFADREFYQKLIRLTLPISLQSLMLAAVAAGDAVMLGRVAQDSMAAVSLATQIQFVQNMILSSVTGAGAILGAQYFGKKDQAALGDIFHLMLRLTSLVCVIFFAACVFLPNYLMLAFTHDAGLIRIGADYLRIAGWSYLITGASQCYLTMMKVTDHASPSAWISSGAVVINILLNAVFIFGLLGAPAMNVQGAALATLIARIIEMALCLIVTRRSGFLRPQLRRILRRNRVLSQDFSRCCLPLLGGSLFWGVGFTAYTAITGHMGENAAAANAVAAVVRDLMCCLCNGISSAGGIMVGNELGAGRLEKGKKYGNRLAKISFVIGFFSTAAVLLLTPLVVRFVILTDEARQYLTGMMIIMAVYMIGRSANTVIINGVFAAGGDTLFDVYSLAVCMWGLAIPLVALGTFVFHWPVLAVYACTCLDEVGKIPWVLCHHRKYKWVRDLTRDHAPDA